MPHGSAAKYLTGTESPAETTKKDENERNVKNGWDGRKIVLANRNFINPNCKLLFNWNVVEKKSGNAQTMDAHSAWTDEAELAAHCFLLFQFFLFYFKRFIVRHCWRCCCQLMALVIFVIIIKCPPCSFFIFSIEKSISKSVYVNAKTPEKVAIETTTTATEKRIYSWDLSFEMISEREKSTGGAGADHIGRHNGIYWSISGQAVAWWRLLCL